MFSDEPAPSPSSSLGVRPSSSAIPPRSSQDGGSLPRRSAEEVRASARPQNQSHKHQRNLFNHAFRPAKINEFEPFALELANQLIDRFADAGRCEFVADYAVPLPLALIGRQMGVPDEDMMKIKAWTDSWII